MKSFKIMLAISLAIVVSGVAYAYDFMNNGYYFNVKSEKDRTCVITYWFYGDWVQNGNVVIPRKTMDRGKLYDVEGIDISAFENCTRLKSVVISESVKSIGAYAFRGCKNLRYIILPENLTNIGDYAFYDSGLTSIALDNVKTIGKWAFAMSSELRNVTGLSPDVKIADKAFYGTAYEQIVGSADSKQSVVNAKPAAVVNGSGANKVKAEPRKNVVTREAQPIDRALDENIPVSGTSAPNTFAVIIGNEHYQNVAEVPFAENDAKVFGEYCKKTLGLPKENIRIYTDATYGNLLGAINGLRQISQAYNGNINVLFYYAGHGIPDEKTAEAYIMPTDASGTMVETCYSLNSLYSVLGNLGAKSVVAFIDACFSGAQRGDGMIASARGVAIKPKSSAVQGNMVIFSASSGRETAYPYKEKGHGMFTYFLLKKLQESKGRVTLGELENYVKTNVKQKSVVLNGKLQTPVITPSDNMLNSWRSMKLN